MKSIIILALLGASLLAWTPTASACAVTDPTGTTTTCVDHETHGGGSCAEATGTELHHISAGTHMSGVVYADTDTYLVCSATGSGDIHYGVGTGIVWVEPLGVLIVPTVSVLSSSAGVQCVAGVTVYDEGGVVQQQGLGCPALPP